MASTFFSYANHRLPFAASVLIVLPWLNPFAPGPMPSVVPFLFSWACVAMLLAPYVLPCDRSQAARCVAGSWLIAATLSCVVGLLQYFGQTKAMGYWVSTTEMGDAFGNLRQRNQFATLTSIGLMALLWWVAQWRPAPSSGMRVSVPQAEQWVAWAACAAALAMGNAASGSRTGLMQWALVVVLLALWRRRMRWHTLAIGLGALALYGLAIRFLPWVLELTTGFHSSGLMGRFNEETGCSSRRILWANVLHLVTQKPWLGWGWGELGYAHFTTLYPAERFCDILDNAHNLPLHLAVELGVPFSLAVCAALAWLVWRARPWRESNPTRRLAWGVLAVIALHSLVEYPLWYGPFQMATGLSVWLLWFAPGAPEQVETDLPRAHSSSPILLLAPVLKGTFAITLIVAVTYSAWDYWRVSQLYLLPADRAAAYRDNTFDKVRDTRLFGNQVQFAELTASTLRPDNAEYLHAMAHRLLHFSPEPRVIEKLIEAAVMLERDDEAVFYLERFKAAFPQAHAAWATESAGHKVP